MRCKNCNGTGNVIFYDSEVESTDIEKCIHCNGKGVVEPLTNEEHMRSCTTEELAGAIYEWYSQGHIEGKRGKNLSSVTRVVEWLKQPHTTKE